MSRFLPLALVALVAVAGAAPVRAQADAQTHFNRGFSLYQQAQFHKALAEFEDGVKLSPARADGYRLIGLCYIQLKDYDRAIAVLKKALELSAQTQQEDEAAKIALGRAYYYKQQYAEALPLLEYAALKQENSANYYLLGNVHFRLNNFEAAQRALDKAAVLSPKDPAALELLAQSLLQRAAAGQDATAYAQAVKAGQRLKAVRDDAATAALLGQAYLGAKQYKEAVAELKKAADALPTSGPLQLAYGQALAVTEQWALAQAALQKAAEQFPTNQAVFNLLGYVYEAEGARTNSEQTRGAKYAAALAAYTKADQLANGADAAIKASIERVKPFAKQP